MIGTPCTSLYLPAADPLISPALAPVAESRRAPPPSGQHDFQRRVGSLEPLRPAHALPLGEFHANASICPKIAAGSSPSAPRAQGREI